MKSKTLVITRNQNPELYRRTSRYHQELGDLLALRGYNFSEKYIIDSLLSGQEYDWVINIDEDARILDPRALKSLLSHMEAEGFGFCGLPDGGFSRIRSHNPYIPNAFFNVFQMKLIRNWIDPSYMKKFRPSTSDLARCEAKYSKLIGEAVLPYRCDLFEPYYPIFIYLELNGVGFLPLTQNTQLDSSGREIPPQDLYNHPEGRLGSTILKYSGLDLCLHTWWGRFYQVDPHHTKRIDRDLEAFAKLYP